MIFLDLLFPPKTNCILCGKMIREGKICDDCESKLPFISGNTCIVCGKPIDTGEKCPDCMEYEHIFSRSISAFEYDETMKSLIARFKYYKERNLSEFFAEYMYKYIKDADIKFDVIVPVPLHRTKLDERGYNQAELLARELSYRFDIIMSKPLRRIRNTKSQTEFSREERMKNLKGAFKVVYEDMVKNKIILLVDDVLTTGSTLDECAKVLKEGGAKDVFATTIATGRNV
ncbi:amidophosphoribosyltransferase [Thermoanaerobacterium thermosaccharolyticum]|uniref:Amidophosphoribosyltransferase n=1 Tax=Thermoanaerobacterium thermosaccharolyticum TaxID=1517 RepID=A0A231VKH3_THETR|nr:ComF family protein [Thermoanaerobacterium thermosaccharolyticum]OXT08732.1 amidophosphoribosyltransferase [Thermoanaerobacterium thermosaccharolyticum]